MDEVSVRPMRVIDCDVHHGFESPEDLHPYLSKVHQARLTEWGLPGGVGSTFANNGGVRGARVDLTDDPQGVGPGDTDIRRCQQNVFVEAGVDLGVLTGFQMYAASAMTDVKYASSLCRAYNDYTIEHWLGADKRFRFAASVCTQDPEGAAVEIDRIGDIPGVVSIMMPCGAPRPYGHQFYHPIYTACERTGLQVQIHFGGEGTGINPPPSSAGFPTNYIEGRQIRPSFYHVHLCSFIFEGVFEKFPSLKVIMSESGFTWVPPALWRMNADWKGLRHQTPWVKKLPSEYVSQNVRFCSQPYEDLENPLDMTKILEWMDAGQTLMFATDYPHWDWDDPRETFRGIPEPLRHRIFHQNAEETYGV